MRTMLISSSCVAVFTIKVTAAVDGRHIWQVTDSRADKLYGRHIKESISKLIGALPFWHSIANWTRDA